MRSDCRRPIHKDARKIDAHSATGQDTSIISPSVSYVLGLSSTSLTVNTACSSRLWRSIWLVQSARARETSTALAGAVSGISSPHSMVLLTNFGAMPPLMSCRVFEASANGYLRGKGGRVLVLKPLRPAQADGETFYCVLRGSATNNAGFFNGLTSPNPKAQEAVLTVVLASASLTPEASRHIETYGPGQDPRRPDRSELVGSRFASDPPRPTLDISRPPPGLAGLIMAALAIRHRTLPRPPSTSPIPTARSRTTASACTTSSRAALPATAVRWRVSAHSASAAPTSAPSSRRAEPGRSPPPRRRQQQGAAARR